MKKNILKTIWHTIKTCKILRTLNLLNAVFILFAVSFVIIGVLYSQQYKENQVILNKNRQDLINLQRVVLSTKDTSQQSKDNNLSKEKSFTAYEEVIPFITVLENMFVGIDKNTIVAMQSKEDQIAKNHFAEYGVSLKISDKKAFFNSLNKLYSSRFIVQLTDFSMKYKETSNNEGAILSDTDFKVRLFLK